MKFENPAITVVTFNAEDILTSSAAETFAPGTFDDSQYGAVTVCNGTATDWGDPKGCMPY